MDYKYETRDIRFVRSHCSGFVEVIVECWSVFENLSFRALTLVKCVFINLLFCGYQLLILFLKTSVFVAFRADHCEHFHRKLFSPFLYKTEPCERGRKRAKYFKQ